MKGKTRGKWKRKGDTGKLQKYMISVDEFVSKVGGGGETTTEDHGNRLIKNKSRKELRKEKRKLKKIKKKHYYEGNKDQFQINSSISKHDDDGKATTTVKKDKNPAKRDSKKPHKATLNESEMKNSKETGGQTSKAKRQSKETAKKKSKLQEHRKQALLEANAAEDKEIKKLERYLGLNKRKNKKTLPQSFAADGLDYILGALDPGLSASGMYESDEEMEVTDVKDKLKKLEGSDCELSDNADEQDDSANDAVDLIDSDNDSEEMDVIAHEEDDEEDSCAEYDSGEASECEEEEHDKEEPTEDTMEVADGKEDDASKTVFKIYCSFAQHKVNSFLNSMPKM